MMMTPYVRQQPLMATLLENYLAGRKKAQKERRHREAKWRLFRMRHPHLFDLLQGLFVAGVYVSSPLLPGIGRLGGRR